MRVFKLIILGFILEFPKRTGLTSNLNKKIINFDKEDHFNACLGNNFIIDYHLLKSLSYQHSLRKINFF